jgi:hypothetical protein
MVNLWGFCKEKKALKKKYDFLKNKTSVSFIDPTIFLILHKILQHFRTPSNFTLCFVVTEES